MVCARAQTAGSNVRRLPAVTVLVLAAVLVLLVGALLALVSARRARERVDDAQTNTSRLTPLRSIVAPPSSPTPPPAAPAAPPAEPGLPPPESATDTSAHRPSLGHLLEGVQFPDDLRMLTYGMNPADLDVRLVLVTEQPPGAVRALLDAELRRLAFAVAWDSTLEATAERDGQRLRVTLHPPTERETQVIEAPQPPGRRRKPLPPLTREDFPSAPMDSVVIELIALREGGWW